MKKAALWAAAVVCWFVWAAAGFPDPWQAEATAWGLMAFGVAGSVLGRGRQ